MRVLRWPGLERLGAAMLAVLVVAIVLLQATSVLLNWAAEDARLQAAALAHEPLERERTPAGMWLSARLLGDIPPGASTQTRRDRAEALDHVADRLREIAGVSALAGLLVAPLTASSAERTPGRSREATAPAARTASNGTL
jgi:hypothetical protein